MHTGIGEDETLRHKVTDPPGYERFVSSPTARSETARVMWEYTYSRFGTCHGPHTVSAATLSEAKDEIRRRHDLPDYRGIRVQRSA
jgi:hypothetical protein